MRRAISNNQISGAELEAILFVLELDNSPEVRIEIKSDSEYAVNCMNKWIKKKY